MDRALFEGWGLELNDEDFARAVAALVVRREQVHPEQLGPTEPPVIVHPWPIIREDPRELRDEWLKFRQGRSWRDGPRFSVMDVSVRESFAFAEILSHPAVGAASCYIDHKVEDANIVWNFPLRIGLLPEFRGDEARAIVDSVYWKQLFRVVDLSASDRECEILLLPANMRSAVAAVLALRFEVRADCVLVAGSRDDEWLGLTTLLNVLRRSCHASALAIADIPREDRDDWFSEFIRNFAHDLPLDAALFAASSKRTPFIVGSAQLIEQSRIGRHVDVLTRHLERMAEPIDEGLESLGPPEIETTEAALGALRNERMYDAETHGATEIANIKDTLPPEMQTAPLAAEEPRKDRTVVTRTMDGGEKTTTLRGGRVYRTFVRIGFPKETEVAAAEPLPIEKLPPSKTGHDLTIVFCEIPQKPGDDIQQPQTQWLHLPLHEETSEVEFFFRTREDAERYEARIIVVHQNRVLQTLSYGAKLDGESPIVVAPEVDVYPLDQLGGRERFDAAIVLNRAPLDMRPCIIVNDKAKYLPSIDEKQIKKIADLLEPVQLQAKLPQKLSDAALTGLLLKLAHHGHTLWRGLAVEHLGPTLANAARIQVVAARPGEFLPVEIFYPREAPMKETLCANGPQILNGAAAARCSSAKAVEELCPVEFWGLNRVIEHVAYLDAQKPKAGKPRKAEPLFRQALLGVSDEVRKKDAAALEATLKKVTGGNVARAKSWQEWEKFVANEKPSLLVLLPHVDEDPRFAMPALEIGGDLLPISSIVERHVRAPGSAQQPVVLLLGCNTTLAEIELQNAVEAFRAEHAGVVLGTISTILGRHAAGFAMAFLEALKDASGKGKKFGDVLLDVKRRRLAAGDPFALALAAYGDSEIRI